MLCEAPSGPVAFIGKYNKHNWPDGFVRVINTLGNIYEGSLSSDCLINGFCISYIGSQN